MEKIKCVIFDFDETLYSSSNRQGYLDFLKKAVTELGGKTAAEADRLLTQAGFTLTNKPASFNSQLSTFGITREQWDSFKINNCYIADPKGVEILPNELYRELRKKCRLFIVSNEFLQHIEAKAAIYGIDLSVFDIYVSAGGSKKPIYERVMKDCGVTANQVLVIGDRMKVDIEPMLELGGNGALVRDVKEVKDLIGKLLKTLKA